MFFRKTQSSKKIGLRQERGTIDHCLVLDHLIPKYASGSKKFLFSALVDLSPAFDSVYHDQLWAKWQSNIDRCLLIHIRGLYKTGPNTQLTKEISVTRGIC